MLSKIIPSLVLAGTVLCLPTFAAAPPDPLRAGFANPPVEARPRGLWTWLNGNFDLAEITHELEEAKAKGMGGLDIWDISPVVDELKNVPPGEPFMSEKYVKAIAHAAREAKRLGLDLGLTIASGWNAGGAWTRPEFATMGLFRSERVVSGPVAVKLDLPFPELPKGDARRGELLIERGADGLPVFWREVALLAFPEEKEFAPSRVVNLAGKTSWDAPAGKWKVVRYVCTNTGQPMFSHAVSSRGPMIDHFNPEATEAHMRYFIERLERELGPLAQSGLSYLYTDSYEVRGELWTPRMLELFRQRLGYDMTPFLPVLEGKVVGDANQTERFRYDYAKLLSDLIIDGHYARGKQICNRHGIKFAAEAAGPGQPIHNCPFESLKSSGALDIPRGEFWHKASGRNSDILQVIRGVASGSHIYNQKYVEAESFTSVWMWQESMAELKPTADRAFAEGLNRVIFHTFPHSPKAAGKPGWAYSFGTQVSDTQPWWPMARPFMDYLSRTSFLLQQGHFRADVLYYYGDQAPNFVMPKQPDQRIGFGYDYEHINSDVILNRLAVRNGRLVLPHGPSYEILVLPEQNAVNLEVLRKIEKLILDGATVVGPKPSRSVGLLDWEKNDAEVKQIADRIWGDCSTERAYGKGRVVCATANLRGVLEKRGVKPAVQAPGAESKLDFLQRSIGGGEIFFVRNTTAQDIAVDAVFRAPGKAAEFWDPLTGQSRPAAQGNAVRLELEPNGSVFVVFRAAKVGPVAPAAQPREVPLEAEWTLTVPGAEPVRGAALASWSESSNDAIRYFSGTGSYRAILTAPAGARRVLLELGRVEIVARVLVNGKEAGITWNPPFRVDITNALKPGPNELVVEVANTWPNRMIGDAKLPPEQRSTNSNIIKLPNSWMYPLKELPSDKYALRPAGLLGPVKLLLY